MFSAHYKNAGLTFLGEKVNKICIVVSKEYYKLLNTQGSCHTESCSFA